MGWQPILDGDLAADALRVVREIGDALGKHAPERTPAWETAMFWAYASGTFGDAATTERYDAATGALVTRIEQGFSQLQLYGGLAGAGFVLAHVADGGAEEALATFDEMFAESLSGPWSFDYDLIRGLTGFGVYFLERLESPDAPESARAGLERVLHHLAASAERVGDGVTWHTRPEWLPPWQRETAPAGYYNCGVAHGVPGTIAMLGRAAALADPPPHARELAARATTWLRTQQFPGGEFPGSVTPGVSASRARTAWCYGDPGIAAALWSAARRTGQPDADWRALAIDAAARPADRCGIRDAGLCHGAMGLAHIYNRCFQASGDEVFADAARAWIARGLAMRRPGEGVAGFLQYGPVSATRPREWEPVEDFLEGAIGIGLSLLAAVGDEAPGWDRLLLCDIPPRGDAP